MSAPRLSIELPSLLHAAAGGASRVAVEATTLRAALDALIACHPGLGPHLFDDAGELRPHVNLFLGERNVRWLDGWDEPIRDGDTLLILQAVSGG